MEFRPTEGQVAVAKARKGIAEKEMRPAVMKHDESQEFPFEIVRKLGELGFMGMTVARRNWGGRGSATWRAATGDPKSSRALIHRARSRLHHTLLCTGATFMLFGQ